MRELFFALDTGVYDELMSSKLGSGEWSKIEKLVAGELAPSVQMMNHCGSSSGDAGLYLQPVKAQPVLLPAHPETATPSDASDATNASAAASASPSSAHVSVTDLTSALVPASELAVRQGSHC